MTKTVKDLKICIIGAGLLRPFLQLLSIYFDN